MIINYTELLIGSLLSLCATIIFAFLLFKFLTPKIDISKAIAEIEKGDKKFYKIKFINKSYFKAFDIKMEMVGLEEYEAQENGEGVNVRGNMIPLTSNNVLFVSGYKRKVKRYAQNCITVRVKEVDLRELLSKNNSYLEFRLTLKHGFSNLSGTFNIKYRTSGCITKGDFMFGNTFEIS